jgi:hypothetical protein
MQVKPATWHRRIAAQTLDLCLLGLALVLLAPLLPEGPPPADSMAFFTGQDFINYFTLVAAALLLTVLAFQIAKVTRATPGQRLLSLRLTTLGGLAPSHKQVNIRLMTAIRNLLLIMLPGPIIALLVGASVAAVLNIPFTTTDKLLLKLEIPQSIRYAIHGVSFLALLAAVWAIAFRPTLAYFERAQGGLTGLDVKSGTTHVYRGDA